MNDQQQKRIISINLEVPEDMEPVEKEQLQKFGFDVIVTLSTQPVTLIDILNYLQARQEHLPFRISHEIKSK